MRKQLTTLKTRIKNQKGFTLIELMAVIAILAMIVLIAVPAVGSILTKAEDGSREAHMAMIENAGELAYVGESANPQPGELGKRDSYTAKELVDGGYLNAELTPEDETIVVTKDQRSGTFSVGGSGSISDDDFDNLLAALVAAAEDAEANGDPLWSFDDREGYPVGSLGNNGYIGEALMQDLVASMDMFVDHPMYNPDLGPEGNALVLVRTIMGYSVDWVATTSLKRAD